MACCLGKTWTKAISLCHAKHRSALGVLCHVRIAAFSPEFKSAVSHSKEVASGILWLLPAAHHKIAWVLTTAHNSILKSPKPKLIWCLEHSTQDDSLCCNGRHWNKCMQPAYGQIRRVTQPSLTCCGALVLLGHRREHNSCSTWSAVSLSETWKLCRQSFRVMMTHLR